MHAWSRYVQNYLDDHQMKPADLARKSGVSPQVISTILNDSRSELVQRPDQKTVELLAAAMGVAPDVLLAQIGEAMGLPVTRPVVIYDASRVSNEDLIRTLVERLDARAGDEHGREPAPTNLTGVVIEDDAVVIEPPQGARQPAHGTPFREDQRE